MPVKVPGITFKSACADLLLLFLLLFSFPAFPQEFNNENAIRAAIEQWCGQSGYSYSEFSAAGLCEFNNRGTAINQSTGNATSPDDIKGEASVATRAPTGKEQLALSPKRAINGHPTRHTEWFAPDGAVGVGVAWLRADRIITVRTWVYGFDEIPLEYAENLKTRARIAAEAIDKLIDFSTPIVTCQAPIDRAAETDRTLDFLARFLSGAIEQPDPVINPDVLTPIARGPARNRWQALRGIADAAELGQFVWDTSAGLQVAANLGQIPISHAQAQRIKAFGHWVVYLKARHQAWNKYFAAEDMKDAQQIYFHKSGNLQSKGSSTPKVPLTADESVLRAALAGPITVEVPPPAIRVLVAESAEQIWNETYGVAFAKSVIELTFVGLDQVYTRGVLMSLVGATQGLYDAYKGHPGGILVALLEGLSHHRYGPYAIALYTGIVEFRAMVFDWDNWYLIDHLGNWAALVNSGIAPFSRPASPGLPKSTMPIDEGLRPATKRFNGKSYHEVSDRKPSSDRRSANPDRDAKYVDIEFLVPGDYVGKPEDAPGLELKRFEGAQVIDTPEGPRYFHPKNGEPLIPVGETGYHLWSHLVETKMGLDTGKTSVLDVYDKTRHEPRLFEMVKAMFDPKADRNRINTEYIEFINGRLSASRQPRSHGLESYKPHLEKEHIHHMQVWSKCTQQYEVVKVTASLEGQAMNVMVVDPGKRPVIDRVPIFSPDLNNGLWSSASLDPFLFPENWGPK